jgi:hypothetical protein
MVIVITTFTTKGIIAHKRRKVAYAESIARYTRILQAGKSGNTDDEDELLRVWNEETHYLPYELYDKFRLASSAIRTSRHQQVVLADLSELLQAAHSTAEPQEKFIAYMNFFEMYLNKRVFSDFPRDSIDFDIEAEMAIAAQILQSYIDDLAEAAQNDTDAFDELNSIRINLESSYDCLRILCDLIRLPANYNQLVAINIANPHYKDFVGTRHPHDISTGIVRRLAAEALRDSDFTQAKIVLAYCNASHYALAEVGDVLTADLAEFVAAYEADLVIANPDQD